MFEGCLAWANYCARVSIYLVRMLKVLKPESGEAGIWIQ